jgi:hypothetical protein
MAMSWQIGRVKVTKIVEIEATGGSRFVLPQATREAILPIAWLNPDFADDAGRLKMSVHGLVIETPHHRIVVDTCLGNDKETAVSPDGTACRRGFSQTLPPPAIRARRSTRSSARIFTSTMSAEHDADSGARRNEDLGPDFRQCALSLRPRGIPPLDAAA